MKEAQANTGWLETLKRGTSGEGMRGILNNNNGLLMVAHMYIGYGALIREYVYFLQAKLAFHKHHPEFNGSYAPRDNPARY